MILKAPNYSLLCVGPSSEFPAVTSVLLCSIRKCQKVHRVGELLRMNSRVFFSAGHGQPGASQGSPCGLDKVPSPQSIISSSKPLVKSEHNQVRVCVTVLSKLRTSLNSFFLFNIN